VSVHIRESWYQEQPTTADPIGGSRNVDLFLGSDLNHTVATNDDRLISQNLR
jgi:hypothetical protein